MDRPLLEPSCVADTDEQPTSMRWRNRTGGTSIRWRRSASAVALLLVACSTAGVAAAVTMLGIGFSPVLTNSMSPSYGAGSVAITRQKPTLELAAGDVVILPLSEGQRYMHRVVDVQRLGSRTHVRTKGDHNSVADPWTLEVTSLTAPVTIGSIPYLGWTTKVLRQTTMRLLLAGVVVAFTIVGLRDARRLRKRAHGHQLTESASLDR